MLVDDDGLPLSSPPPETSRTTTTTIRMTAMPPSSRAGCAGAGRRRPRSRHRRHRRRHRRRLLPRRRAAVVAGSARDRPGRSGRSRRRRTVGPAAGAMVGSAGSMPIGLPRLRRPDQGRSGPSHSRHIRLARSTCQNRQTVTRGARPFTRRRARREASPAGTDLAVEGTGSAVHAHGGRPGRGLVPGHPVHDTLGQRRAAGAFSRAARSALILPLSTSESIFVSPRRRSRRRPSWRRRSSTRRRPRSTAPAQRGPQILHVDPDGVGRHPDDGLTEPVAQGGTRPDLPPGPSPAGSARCSRRIVGREGRSCPTDDQQAGGGDGCDQLLHRGSSQSASSEGHLEETPVA